MNARIAKNPGIIHSISRCWRAWMGSVDGVVLIFCISHIDPATSTARMPMLSGTERSIHRKLPLTGTTLWDTVTPGYSMLPSSMRRSGDVGSTRMTAQYMPMRMGIWITRGPRHPTGLTPNSL